MHADADYEPDEWADGKRLEELEWLLEEIKDFIDMLNGESPLLQRIRMRIPRHTVALEQLAEWCRAEIDSFGLWREDEEDFEDIYDAIWQERHSINDEINDDMAMSWTLDSRELARCRDLAAELLASERYLSGTVLDFLYDVVSGEIFDTRWLREIAVNHDRWFKV